MTQFLCSLETKADQFNPEILLKAWQNSKVIHLRVTDLAPEDVLGFYDRLLPKIGTAYALAEDVRVGDRNQQKNGEIWTEIRYDPAFPNAYRHSPNAQPLHTDGSYSDFPYASLMCCVVNASEGGETVFIDSDVIVKILAEEDPELLTELENTIVPHARSGDSSSLPVIRHDNGVWRVNWNYYCVDMEAGEKVLDLRERFQQFLLTSPQVRNNLIPVKLQTGDAVVWKDDELLHGRNSFRADRPSERFLWKCAIDIGVFAGVGV